MCRQSASICLIKSPSRQHRALAGLPQRLATLADPRHRRGKRHPFVSVLLVACSAVLAGARSPEPIADAGRSRVLKTLVNGDVVMARLDQEDRDHLSGKQYAFPKERKEPLEDARHVRNAVARFDQVEGVTDAERDAAWKRIQKAAKKYDVKLEERSWRELGKPDD